MAFASDAVFYDIPAQNLNRALTKFANDSGLELIFSSDLVSGIRSNPVRGRIAAEQALAEMLKHSGLDYRFIDAHTLTLVRRSNTAEAAKIQANILDAVTVLGDARANSAWLIDREISDEAPDSYRVSHVVSATRTDSPIRSVPQSVQAIKRNLIEDQQNITISETLYNVSGIVPRNPLSTPVIEGTLVRGFRAEQLIDGFTQYYNTGDRESTVNIDRIEVLKGANAIFYSGGSGSPVGGVINIVSKLPKPKAFREIGFRGGSYDFYQPYFDLNQPVTDRALFRITAEYTDSGSQINVLETERFNVNPALFYKYDDDTSLVVQARLSHWQQPEYQGLPAAGTVSGDFNIPPQTFIGPTPIPDSKSDNDAVWTALSRRIDDVWVMEIKARYALSEFLEKTQSLFNGTSFIADTPLAAPAIWALVNAELSQQQREIAFQAYAQAQFNFGMTENNFMLGVDHSQLRDEGYIDVGGLAGLVDFENPVFKFPYRSPGPAISNQSVENISYGGYLQLQSSIATRSHALLALRLGGVEIGYNNQTRLVDTHTQSLELLPRVGFAYDLTDQMTLFAGYNEGIRGQPFVNFADTPEPEQSRQMEAGIKLDFYGKLSGQVAAYQIDRDQVAVTQLSSPSEFNAVGRQRSSGVEVDLVWQPVDYLSVLGNYAHTDARFVNGIAANNRLTGVPEDSGRVWAHYRFGTDSVPGLSVGMGIYLRSGAYVSDDNRFKTGGYYLFDTAINYELGRIKLAATVKNLTDEMYFQPLQYFGGGLSGGGRVVPAMGRAFYLSAAMKF